MGRWSDICTKGESSDMIYGYILVMVAFLPSGEIQSEAINWFPTPYECVEEGYHQENNAEFGVGYVCVEDTVPIEEKDLDG